MKYLGAVLLALLCGFLPVRAARLPDWARPIAEQAPAVEASPSTSFDSRVLLTETTLTVLPDGTLRTHRLLARQSLQARAEGVGVEGYGFGMNSRIKSAKVWHLPPGEKPERSQSPALDLADYATFATDRKTRVVRVNGVRKGSLVFFEFEAEEREPTLDWAYTFYEGQPIREARLHLQLSPGWSVHHAWMRTAGPAPEIRGSTYSWTLHDLEPPPREDLAPRPYATAPLLALTMIPPPVEGIRDKLIAEPLPSWKAMGLWYERLAQGREEPTSAVRAAAAAALRDAGDDPIVRILRASAYVRDKVRYIDREVGIGGYQPHPAQQVATELVGDCKDKGTLLRSILAADGRRSYPVLVNATTEDTVADAIPSVRAFNHFIVAVEIPPDRPLPEHLSPAVLDAGELGKLLIVDTTDEYLAPGAVAASFAGKHALLVADRDSRIVTLPGMDAEAHRIERTLQMEAAPDGAVRWERVSRYWGEPATLRRADYRRGIADRRRSLESWIAERWPGATVTRYEAEDETADGAFVETLAWTSPPGSKLDIFPGAEEDIPRVPLTERAGPVVYPHPVSIDYTATFRGARTGSVSAAPVEASGEGWTARRTTEIAHGVLTAGWSVRLDRTRYPLSDSAALKALWSGLRKTSNLRVEVGGD
ncbi:MAG TPA: DUF3857 domain-containing protein [Candidatus Polarisedimenticolaceae bacterium]|nr:DUF3857 domain-containing protein [Candidatus Polarisedimenticolaceae bacterium]